MSQKKGDRQVFSQKYLKYHAERITDIFEILLFTLFPLIVYPDYTNITQIKYIVFLVLSGLLTLSILFYLGEAMLNGYRPEIRLNDIAKNLPEYFCMAFVLLAFFSYLFCSDHFLENSHGQSAFFFGSGRYDGFLVLLLYVAVFFILSFWGNFQKKHIVMLAVTVIIMSLIGIIQLGGINLFYLCPPQCLSAQVADFISTSGNINIFSGIFSMLLPLIASSYILFPCSYWEKGLLLLALFLGGYLMLNLHVSSGITALTVTTLLVTPFFVQQFSSFLKMLDVLSNFFLSLCAKSVFSSFFQTEENRRMIRISFSKKAGILLLVALVSVWLHFWLRRKKGWPCSARVFQITVCCEIAGVVLLLIYTYFFISPKNNTVLQNTGVLSVISQIFHGRVTAQTGTYRLEIWKYALKMAFRHPLLGTGMGSFLNCFQLFAGNVFSALGRKPIDTAHNEYIQLLCTNGILGLFAYLAFLISLAVSALQNYRRNPTILILGTVILCYCVQAFFNFSIVIAAPLFWCFAGLLRYQIKFSSQTPKNQMMINNFNLKV